MTPDLLAQVAEATWPPAATHRHGPWLIREGQGGGVIHGPDSGLVTPDEGEPGYFSETITDLGAVGTSRLDSANPGEGI